MVYPDFTLGVGPLLLIIFSGAEPHTYIFNEVGKKSYYCQGFTFVYSWHEMVHLKY